MKIILKSTNETVAEILSNHSMSLDDAINLVGEIINDENDNRFSHDGDNVIIAGERYWYDDLDVVGDGWTGDEDDD